MSTLAALLPAAASLGWAVHARWLHRRLTTARHDPLTGLWTRDAFTRRARRLLRDPRAVVVLADVDHFKQINDTHGHAAGDALLATIAARLHHRKDLPYRPVTDAPESRAALSWPPDATT
ncbi:GGDEF domain-containing protein, partial [Streptomyces mirabilis]|uniref:GGDEF domain-containing protein n=1 Tax=Streptomyces mirabilis TaxID=68239 RepID=UPI0033D2568C